MQQASRSAVAIIGGLLAAPVAANAQGVVAAWIQLAPGSSSATPTTRNFGDAPTSLTPTILARAIISGGGCPALTVDGSLSIAMRTRFVGNDTATYGDLTSLTPSTTVIIPNGNTTPTSFANGKPGYPKYFISGSATAPASLPDGSAKATTAWGECEAIIPPGHATASIANQVLKLPVANPKRILVIADTGCRMSGSAQQNCHDPADFPFAVLASQAALLKPDLIVHSGDYFYRDTNCLVSGAEAFTGCNTPANANYETWGDTFDAWNADVFYPARTLLPAAPWVMVRGNHESCGRGARGWFALLDPHPYDYRAVDCIGGAGNALVTTAANYSGDFTPAYIVPAGNVNLLIHDSSYGNDNAVDANMAKNYDFDLTALLAAVPAGSFSFYVTHKPPFGLVAGAPTNSGNFTQQYTLTGAPTGSASAFSGGIPAKIAMLLSGHIHQFEYLNFSDATHFAPQMVVGVSGDKLDSYTNGTTPTYGYAATNFTVHNTAVTAVNTTTVVDKAFSQAAFGFAILDATPQGYTASVYDIAATQVGRCTITLNPRNIACWQ